MEIIPIAYATGLSIETINKVTNMEYSKRKGEVLSIIETYKNSFPFAYDIVVKNIDKIVPLPEVAKYDGDGPKIDGYRHGFAGWPVVYQLLSEEISAICGKMHYQNEYNKISKKSQYQPFQCEKANANHVLHRIVNVHKEVYEYAIQNTIEMQNEAIRKREEAEKDKHLADELRRIQLQQRSEEDAIRKECDALISKLKKSQTQEKRVLQIQTELKRLEDIKEDAKIESQALYRIKQYDDNLKKLNFDDKVKQRIAQLRPDIK